MKNKTLARVFSLDTGEQFAYDGFSNRIITLGPVFKDKTEEEILSSLVSAGLLGEGGFETAMWDADAEEITKKRNHNLRDLVLQITRKCNLNCSYCIYSGKFKGMKPHSDDSMDIDTIKKSIDFFASHSEQTPECSISMYGGESLLEFPLIQYAVSYAKECFKGRKVKYIISSNGTNFSKTVLEWLAENPDVSVAVTLNGNYQDETRRTVNDKGSLDIILKYIAHIKKGYPQIWENQIEFIVNAASYIQLADIRKFYSEVVGKLPATINFIKVDFAEDEDVKKIVFVNEKENTEIKKQLYDEYVYKNDEFADLLFGGDYRAVRDRFVVENDRNAYISSCSPFLFRLFVRTDGSFNICEKVNDSLNLGDVNNGYNEAEIERLCYGIKEFTDRNCLDCWAQRICQFCYQNIIDNNGDIITDMPYDFCEKSRRYALEKLSVFCKKAIYGADD
ncbi:MAG: radical SAM protein [Clostridia bacterium]|nr:radical SAM protein [Clostridia bacterium]